MVAQDVGGAIKGPNRLDLFWGAGPDARAIAGAMAHRNRLALLLPVASVQRLLGDPARRLAQQAGPTTAPKVP